MIMKCKSSDNHTSQRGYDVHLAQFQSCGSNSASQSGQIVFVCISDFLNQAMLSQSFKKPGYLMAFFVFDNFTQTTITESTDVKFSANNSTEQLKVIAVKEIESSTTSVAIFNGPGYFVQVFYSAGRVVDSGDKLNIPAIGCFHQFDKQRHAVNRFFQRRIFHFPCAVPVFHSSVVLKERDIIGYGLNSKDDTELVIHLYGYFAHPMFDTSSFNPRVKVIAHFILVAAVELTAKECGNILGFNRVNGGADNFVIDRFKIVFFLEDYVSSVFDLHKAPVILIDKVTNDRAVLPDDFIQLTMKIFNVDVVSNFLSFIKIFNLHKDIIEQLKINLLLVDRRYQQIVSVTVELQPKRRPGRYSKITQSQLGINKVEVIMQTFAGYRFEICFVSLFVVPGFIGSAGFHRRVDVHQSGMCSALLDNVIDPVFFSKILFADKLDFKIVVAGDFFGICTNCLPQRFSPLCEVEYTNAFCSKKRTHPLSIADTWYGSGKYDSVKAGYDSFDFSAVPLGKVMHSPDSPYRSFQFEELSEKCLAA
jgi:hypothetical protein